MSEATPPLHYFIYYRVRAELDPDDIQAGVCAMQAALARRTGIAGRLMHRAHEEATWMEVYEGVSEPAAFEAALAAEVAAHDLDALVEPGAARHIERFVECA
jgi:hypothetical protein